MVILKDRTYRNYLYCIYSSSLDDAESKMHTSWYRYHYSKPGIAAEDAKN